MKRKRPHEHICVTKPDTVQSMLSRVTRAPVPAPGLTVAADTSRSGVSLVGAGSGIISSARVEFMLSSAAAGTDGRLWRRTVRAGHGGEHPVWKTSKAAERLLAVRDINSFRIAPVPHNIRHGCTKTTLPIVSQHSAYESPGTGCRRQTRIAAGVRVITVLAFRP